MRTSSFSNLTLTPYLADANGALIAAVHRPSAHGKPIAHNMQKQPGQKATLIYYRPEYLSIISNICATTNATEE
jgi:hypothetical protein